MCRFGSNDMFMVYICQKDYGNCFYSIRFPDEPLGLGNHVIHRVQLKSHLLKWPIFMRNNPSKFMWLKNGGLCLHVVNEAILLW